ncbi:MAG: ADP-ribosylation factor-like protein [Candidatus Helarchaeota archaeon]
MTQKVLVLGLNRAGKTTLIRHVLEGKEFSELENIPPTEGIKTDEYRYRRLVEISVFDCGGQKQFIENYFTERMERTIFSNVKAFIWVLDIADKERVTESRTWFKRAYNSLKEFSPKAKIYVLAHKYDKKDKLTKNELKKIFIDSKSLPGVKYFTTSVRSKSARRVLCKIFNGLIETTETERMKALQKLLERLNSRLSAKLIMLINNDDGLEIASAVDSELAKKVVTKDATEFLQYLSIKTLIYPLTIAIELVEQFRKNNFLNSKVLDITVFRFDAEYLILKDIHKYISLFIVSPVTSMAVKKIEQEIDKLSPKLLEVLKLK